MNRYDGREFSNFATGDDDLPSPRSIFEDRNGHLWFFGGDRGSRRYDGERFSAVTAAGDSIPAGAIGIILHDRKGRMWFNYNRRGGTTFYDGVEFTTLTALDGLAGNAVRSAWEDREGNVWLATHNGVSRYDGEGFANFTTREGLAANQVYSIFQDRDGHLWFGTGAGVSIYDGLVFQTVSRRDGLVSDGAGRIIQDASGDIWIGSDAGVTRYRPRHTPPTIRIGDVVGHRRFGAVAEVRVPTTQDLLVFEFQGGSFTTPPERMAYVYQLQGYDSELRWTRDDRVEYTDLPVGDYTFSVRAVDRDLNYSVTAATVEVEVFHQETLSPVTLSDVQIDDLFASYYQRYARVRISEQSYHPFRSKVTTDFGAKLPPVSV